jgi:hypothetical protein
VLGARERARVNLKIIEPETGKEVGSTNEEDIKPISERSTGII